MKDQLRFDTTDAATIADSDKVLSGIISTDGSTLITDTLEGGKQGLDVYVINTDIDTADAANKVEDAAHSSGDTGNFVLAVRNDTEGSLVDADGDYAPLQVDDTGRLRVVADLDTTNLAEKAEDSAHVSGDIGNYVLTVREDTLATSTSADGDYQSFKSTSLGELYVKATDTDALLTTIDGVLDNIYTEQLDQGTTLDAIAVDIAAIEVELLDQGTTLDTIAGDTTSIDNTLTALSKAEDSAHSSGDQGVMGLAVRNDTLASLVDTDGDYAPLQVNADGALYVDVASIDDAALANTSIANAANTMAVAATAEDVVASPLANRKYLYIYNNDNKKIHVGASGVTSANGFPVSPGSYLELRAGASVDIEWVSPDAGSEIRTLELS